jgi:antitoxin CptB
MSGSTMTGAALDVRRRKLLFRAWHRGTREMDLLMGRFADAALAGMSEAELDQFEQLIEVPDHELFDWIMSDTRPCAECDTAVFARLKAFHQHR